MCNPESRDQVTLSASKSAARIDMTGWIQTMLERCSEALGASFHWGVERPRLSPLVLVKHGHAQLVRQLSPYGERE